MKSNVSKLCSKSGWPFDSQRLPALSDLFFAENKKGRSLN